MDDLVARLKTSSEAESLARNADRKGRPDIAEAARARGAQLLSDEKAARKASAKPKAVPESGRTRSTRTSTVEGRVAGESLYLNGVFESVLEEILDAQTREPGLVGYLQPYSKGPIKKLQQIPPSPEAPWRVFFSCTNSLAVVSYQAAVVEWHDKTKLPAEDVARISAEIAKNQPSERGLHLSQGGEGQGVNLLGIVDLRRLEVPLAVAGFVKTSDDIALKDRSRSGGWSYVLPPEDPESYELVSSTRLLEEEAKEARRAAKRSASERRARLAEADPKPRAIMVVSKAFIRNQDVVREVLDRAAGICEGCSNPAPFKRASDGTPYLEVHHIVMLSQGGDDVPENALALCPNCHRYRHFGVV